MSYTRKDLNDYIEFNNTLALLSDHLHNKYARHCFNILTHDDFKNVLHNIYEDDDRLPFDYEYGDEYDTDEDEEEEERSLADVLSEIFDSLNDQDEDEDEEEEDDEDDEYGLEDFLKELLCPSDSDGDEDDDDHYAYELSLDKDGNLKIKEYKLDNKPEETKPKTEQPCDVKKEEKNVAPETPAKAGVFEVDRIWHTINKKTGKKMTTVKWVDGTKTIVEDHDGKGSDWSGFCSAVAKKVYGSASKALAQKEYGEQRGCKG